MSGKPTYLDYNATAPLRPEARAAMLEVMDHCGNPSSTHTAGRQAKARLEADRQTIAEAVGVAPRNIIFTSGGTEANALALTGWRAKRILVSGIEHGCVLAAAERSGAKVEPVRAGQDGRIDLNHLEDLLKSGDEPGSDLLSIMAVNNETGVIQPVVEASQLAREVGALVHCDGVQALGKLDMAPWMHAVDFLALSAHKVGGAAGTGALVVKDQLTLSPMMTGSGQEMGRRAGTENAVGIAGFAAAVKAALADLGKFTDLAIWRDKMEADMRAAVPGIEIIGGGSDRIGNTSNIALPGIKAETQIMALDLSGIAVSAGSACSSGKVQRSHVLAAMGLPDAVSGSAIRISTGWATEKQDMDEFVGAWAEMAERLVARREAAAA